MLLHTLGCSCCGGSDDPFATRFTAVAFEAAVTGRVLRCMSDATDDDFAGEPGTLAFAAEEDALTALMASAVHDAGMAQRHILADAVTRYGDDMQRIHAALDDMAAAIGEPWTKDVETQATDLLASAMKGGTAAGAQKAADLGDLSKDPQSLNMLDGVRRAARYSTNKFFNNLVIPAVLYQAETILSAASPLDAPKLTPILDILDQRLRSVPYWNIVANAAASRGYHYGLARTAQLRGRTQYQFTAVVDEKTSKVCLELNGKVFSVNEAVDMMDWVARAETVEEIKQIMPWPKLKDIQGLSNAELEIRGWAVPPLHGRCRSTMKVI